MDAGNGEILQQVLLDLSPAWDGEAALLERSLMEDGIICARASQNPVAGSKAGTILLTDSLRTAHEAKAHGMPCFGCTKEGDWFEDTFLVLESLEGIDGTYLEEWMLRARGLPARIAHTERLAIREIKEEDFEDLIRIYRQQDVSDREGEDIFTPEGLRAYIRTAYRLQGFGLWSVLYRGKVIGCCGFTPSASALELQYIVDEAYRRQGFGTEMCLAAISYAEKRLDAKKIVARILPGNKASLALAGKLGLTTI